jgi:hypothetical protein
MRGSGPPQSLMFMPYITCIRCIREKPTLCTELYHYLYSIYWLLHVSAVDLPSSGSFLDLFELLEIQMELVDKQYALIYTTPLYYVLAPTCFGSSLPSSRSFLDRSELLEIQIEWWYIIQYTVTLPVCCSVVVPSAVLVCG